MEKILNTSFLNFYEKSTLKSTFKNAIIVLQIMFETLVSSDFLFCRGADMKNVRIKNNEIDFDVDGYKLELKYNIRLTLESIKKYGDFAELLSALKRIDGSIYLCLMILNNAVKQYNREYNTNVKPFTAKSIVGLFDDVDNIRQFMLGVRKVCIKAVTMPKLSSSGNANNNANADNAIYKVITTALFIGLDYQSILDMELCELAQYIDAYNSSSSSEVAVREGVPIKHLGSLKKVFGM